MDKSVLPILRHKDFSCALADGINESAGIVAHAIL